MIIKELQKKTVISFTCKETIRGNKINRPGQWTGDLFFLFITCLVTVLQTLSLRAQSQPPYLSTLTPTPRANFTPTPPAQKGYWNVDIVGDFYLPASKTMTFCGAGRNLHANQDREKLFPAWLHRHRSKPNDR